MYYFTNLYNNFILHYYAYTWVRLYVFNLYWYFKKKIKTLNTTNDIFKFYYTSYLQYFKRCIF